MDYLVAKSSVSITDLKKNPSSVIKQADGSPVVILNHNRPSAYIVPADAFEATQLRHLEGAKTYSTCRLETRLFSLRCLYCSVLYI
jgi:prevent-host-death family protein